MKGHSGNQEKDKKIYAVTEACHGYTKSEK